MMCAIFWKTTLSKGIDKMFKDKLYTILRDLNKMVSNNNAMERCVNTKLNNSLDMYAKNVINAYSYLVSKSTKNTYRVIKNIAKMNKEDVSKWQT